MHIPSRSQVEIELSTAWSAQDLRWVVQTAIDRGAHLLTAGEVVVLDRLTSLAEPALDTYARLSNRVSPFQRAEGLPHLSELEDAGLVDDLVPWSVRARRSTVAELKLALTQLGLPRRGRRDVLVERVSGHTHFNQVRWIRVRHRALIRRLERWAFLKSRPERSALVVERLGHVRWPNYAITRGQGLFSTRQGLLSWEALLDEQDPESLCGGLERNEARGPGRLDRTRSVARSVLEMARELERGGDPGRARALYERVRNTVPRYATRCTIRIARTLEAEDRQRDAYRDLQSHRPQATGPDRIALNRAGRRLGRVVRCGWAPDRPSPPVRERSLKLVPAAHTGLRPTYRDGLVVEHAVIDLLAERGRTALHGEGHLWRTLFALVFADCYFLPVPGQLPVRHLSGPLDLGTPAFFDRRRGPITARLEAVARGEAPRFVREAWAEHGGSQLSGCRWEGDDEAWAEIAGHIPGSLIRVVLEILLTRGWSATRGMPDLILLPGPATEIRSALPRRLHSGLSLIEVKGPTDTLSDAQRWWIATLAEHTAIEVWNVKPAGSKASG